MPAQLPTVGYEFAVKAARRDKTMIKLFVKSATALSLMLAASATAPAWSADRHSAAKCPYAKHKHVKRTVAAKPQPVRSIMLVESRKQDVQILSFGP